MCPEYIDVARGIYQYSWILVVIYDIALSHYIWITPYKCAVVKVRYTYLIEQAEPTKVGSLVYSLKIDSPRVLIPADT